MSASGSPLTATISASLPASNVPEIRVDLQRLRGIVGRRQQCVHRLHAELHIDLQLRRVRAHAGSKPMSVPIAMLMPALCIF